MRLPITSSKIRKKILKSVAAFTAIFMAVSGLSVPAYAAAPSSASSPAAISNIQNYKVPSDFGTLEEKFTGKTSSAVILIQDAHSIEDAQRSIFNLIQHAEKEYGIRRIAAEGSSTPFDAKFLKNFPNPAELEHVMDFYFQQGELTGPAAAAIFDSWNADIRGIEDWNLFEQGTEAYLKAAGYKETLLGKLSEDIARLASEKARNYSRELWAADQVITEFYRDHVSLLQALQTLSAYHAPEHSSLQTLLKQTAQENHSLTQALREAAKRVESALRTKSGYASEQRLFNEKYQSWNTGRISGASFAHHLKSIVEKYRLRISLHSVVEQSFLEEKTLRSLRGTQLLKDFESYAEETMRVLIARGDDKTEGLNTRLYEQTKELRLLEKLAQLELSREQWEQVKASSVERRADTKEFSLNAVRYPLSAEFEAHRAFYEIAEAREKAFMKNLIRFTGSGKHSAVFVAGGFHTQGLADALKELGISYFLVTPKIDRIPEEIPYESQMAGDVSWKNYLKEENGKIYPAKAFASAVRDQLLRKDDRTTRRQDDKSDASSALPFVPSSSRSFMLKKWRDKLILDLASQNRMNEVSKYLPLFDESPDSDKITAWRKNIDGFIQGLEKLHASKSLTPESVTGLLQKPAHIPRLTATVLSQNAYRPELRTSREKYTAQVRARHIPAKSQGDRDRLQLEAKTSKGRRSQWQRHGILHKEGISPAYSVRPELRAAAKKPSKLSMLWQRSWVQNTFIILMVFVGAIAPIMLWHAHKLAIAEKDRAPIVKLGKILSPPIYGPKKHIITVPQDRKRNGVVEFHYRAKKDAPRPFIDFPLSGTNVHRFKLMNIVASKLEDYSHLPADQIVFYALDENKNVIGSWNGIPVEAWRERKPVRGSIHSITNQASVYEPKFLRLEVIPNAYEGMNGFGIEWLALYGHEKTISFDFDNRPDYPFEPVSRHELRVVFDHVVNGFLRADRGDRERAYGAGTGSEQRGELRNFEPNRNELRTLSRRHFILSTAFSLVGLTGMSSALAQSIFSARGAFSSIEIQKMRGLLSSGVGIHRRTHYPYDVIIGSEPWNTAQPTSIGFRIEELALSTAGEVAGAASFQHARRDLTELLALLTQLKSDQKKHGWKGLIPWFKLMTAEVQPDRDEIAYVDNANLAGSLMVALGALSEAHKKFPDLAADAAKATADAKTILDAQGEGFDALYDSARGLFRGAVRRNGTPIQGYYIDRMFSEHAGKTAALIQYFAASFPKLASAKQGFTRLGAVFKNHTFRDGVSRPVPAPWDGGVFQFSWNLPFVQDSAEWQILAHNYFHAITDDASQKGLAGVLSAAWNVLKSAYDKSIGHAFHETSDPVNGNTPSLYALDAFAALFPATVRKWREGILAQVPDLNGPHGNYDSVTDTGQPAIGVYVMVDHQSSILGALGTARASAFRRFMEEKGIHSSFVDLLNQGLASAKQLNPAAFQRFNLADAPVPQVRKPADNQPSVQMVNKGGVVRQNGVSANNIQSVSLDQGFGFSYRQGGGDYGGAYVDLSLNPSLAERHTLYWEWARIGNEPLPKAVMVKIEVGNQSSQQILNIDPNNLKASLRLPNFAGRTFRFVIINEAHQGDKNRDSRFHRNPVGLGAKNFTIVRPELRARRDPEEILEEAESVEEQIARWNAILADPANGHRVLYTVSAQLIALEARRVELEAEFQALERAELRAESVHELPHGRREDGEPVGKASLAPLMAAKMAELDARAQKAGAEDKPGADENEISAGGENETRQELRIDGDYLPNGETKDPSQIWNGIKADLMRGNNFPVYLGNGVTLEGIYATIRRLLAGEGSGLSIKIKHAVHNGKPLPHRTIVRFELVDNKQTWFFRGPEYRARAAFGGSRRAELRNASRLTQIDQSISGIERQIAELGREIEAAGSNHRLAGRIGAAQQTIEELQAQRVKLEEEGFAILAFQDAAAALNRLDERAELRNWGGDSGEEGQVPDYLTASSRETFEVEPDTTGEITGIDRFAGQPFSDENRPDVEGPFNPPVIEKPAASDAPTEDLEQNFPTFPEQPAGETTGADPQLGKPWSDEKSDTRPELRAAANQSVAALLRVRRSAFVSEPHATRVLQSIGLLTETEARIGLTVSGKILSYEGILYEVFLNGVRANSIWVDLFPDGSFHQWGWQYQPNFSPEQEPLKDLLAAWLDQQKMSRAKWTDENSALKLNEGKSELREAVETIVDYLNPQAPQTELAQAAAAGRVVAKAATTSEGLAAVRQRLKTISDEVLSAEQVKQIAFHYDRTRQIEAAITDVLQGELIRHELNEEDLSGIDDLGTAAESLLLLVKGLGKRGIILDITAPAAFMKEIRAHLKGNREFKWTDIDGGMRFFSSGQSSRAASALQPALVVTSRLSGQQHTLLASDRDLSKNSLIRDASDPARLLTVGVSLAADAQLLAGETVRKVSDQPLTFRIHSHEALTAVDLTRALLSETVTAYIKTARSA